MIATLRKKTVPRRAVNGTAGIQENSALRDPDVGLMLRTKEGDEAAFAQLVANNQNRLVGVLAHMLGDAEAAEDVAQEVFFRIYQARHGYEPTARFSTWLFRIANNLALNRRRDTGRRREFVPNGSEPGFSGVRPIERLLADKSGLMPAQQFDKSEMQSIVQAALETLNEKQRMAVLLHKFQEMSYSEIAGTLDMTPAAVKSLLSRARDNLREKLEPYVTRGMLGSIQTSRA
jgi:RNA polymerase sigma-70 factor (ECF subfamily)